MYEYRAKIIKVYDGDTVTAVVDLGFHCARTENVRLARINAPEVRGEERPLGLKARDFLCELILDKTVLIKTYKDKTGKYGRYIADIFLDDGTDVNALLVEKGHAVFQNY